MVTAPAGVPTDLVPARVVTWRLTQDAAVQEAVRLTDRFRVVRPDAPPYRVRKRRTRRVGDDGRRRDLWLIYTPWGWIPDRRP